MVNSICLRIVYQSAHNLSFQVYNIQTHGGGVFQFITDGGGRIEGVGICVAKFGDRRQIRGIWGIVDFDRDGQWTEEFTGSIANCFQPIVIDTICNICVHKLIDVGDRAIGRIDQSG